LEHIQPLYTVDDAQNALSNFDGYPYQAEITIGHVNFMMPDTFWDQLSVL
jgi:hypothetical protein